MLSNNCILACFRWSLWHSPGTRTTYLPTKKELDWDFFTAWQHRMERWVRVQQRIFPKIEFTFHVCFTNHTWHLGIVILISHFSLHRLQGGWGVWPTGNGKKLNSTQAQLAVLKRRWIFVLRPEPDLRPEQNARPLAGAGPLVSPYRRPNLR